MKVKQSLILRFKTSNNQAEYEALIAGLALAEDMRIKIVSCKADSQIVVGQLNEEFQVKEPLLLKYHALALPT